MDLAIVVLVVVMAASTVWAVGYAVAVIRPKTWRVYLSSLVRCPWCAGFYVSAAWWGSWAMWPRETLFAATPWAVSAVVALLEKNLDA